jgi:glycosyltransferase involved in cell wall biosynthesis
LSGGGAEKHTAVLINKINKNDFTSNCIALKNNEKNSAFDVAIDFVNVRRIYDIFGYKRLYYSINHINPDVIVCVNLYPLFSIVILKMLGLLKIPSVCIFHSMPEHIISHYKNKIVRFFNFYSYRFVFKKCDKVIFVSDLQKIAWEKIGFKPKSSKTIFNGVDINFYKIDQEYKNYSNKITIGMCAALRPEKRHQDFLKLIENLRVKNFDVYGLIIGDGEDFSKIEKAINSNKIIKNFVEMTGQQTMVQNYIKKCDIMMLMSEAETFSLAVLESMAMGKPVVITNVGGAKEMVGNGVNGYIFECGDVSSATENIISIINQKKIHSMGIESRKIIEDKFSLDVMIKNYENYFK